MSELPLVKPTVKFGRLAVETCSQDMARYSELHKRFHNCNAKFDTVGCFIWIRRAHCSTVTSATSCMLIVASEVHWLMQWNRITEHPRGGFVPKVRDLNMLFGISG